MNNSKFKIRTEAEEQAYAKISLEPLTQGYGHTLGTSLRRILLSSLKGAAVTMVKIDGVKHQFSTVAGIKEDIVEIILNIKKLQLAYSGDEPVKMHLSAKGKGVVTASLIDAPPQIEVINKDAYIAEITAEKTHLDIDFWVESGYGYSPFEDRKGTEMGIIPIDAVFTPVTRVNYKVESTRVGQMTDLDKLIFEIWTDGSIKPIDALQQSANILSSYLNQIFNPNVDETPMQIATDGIPKDTAGMSLEELDLPTRITNALRNGGIETVGDLLRIPRRELMRIKNVGGKSLTLVEDELKKKGITLSKEE